VSIVIVTGLIKPMIVVVVIVDALSELRIVVVCAFQGTIDEPFDGC